MLRSRRIAWLLAGALLAFASVAGAHQYWPGYLQMREVAPGDFDVLWKIPANGDLRLPLSVSLPEQCAAVAPHRVIGTGNAFIERWSVRCDALAGGTIRVEGLALVPTDALVRVERLDGSAQVARLVPDEPQVTLESAARAGQVAKTYFGLGVEHILLGIDHLLFVLALLLITRGAWRIVKTVTAFTVAHSITLALATLGVVHVPSAPVEAVIALSIVFVAGEILRVRAGQASLTATAPWLVAFAFGLLHGFGFAGALSEVGLPENHIPLALLFFNVGVEVGQLLFIAVALSVSALMARLRWAALPRLAWVVPYAIGTVATFWVIERVLAF